ncbi:MAG: type VI secretion system baseplate subunit TssG [Anaeromyxobacter sp.]
MSDGLPPAPATAPGPTPEERERAARVEAARRQGFVPLLLLLDRLSPGALDVGGEAAPEAERIRFRHDPSLAFAPSDVVAVKERSGPEEAQPRWDITTTFLGVTGTVSPLPPYLAEEVAQEDPAEQRNRAFLDLFHHRAISFLARGLLAYDPAAAHGAGSHDPWSGRLLSWLGLDGPLDGEAAAELGLSDAAARAVLLRASALLAERALTADGLEALLNDAMREELGPEGRITVEQFVGAWLPIPPDDRTRLGQVASGLGTSMVLGSRVFDRSCRIDVVVGPLDRGGYQHFALDLSVQGRLRAVIAHVTRGDVAYDLVLVLAPDAAPPAQLGAARLGRDAWLGRQAALARVRV